MAAFKALMLRNEEGRPRAAIEQVSSELLPDGDVTIAVHYSSLNYKDGLAITGRGPVVRTYPMVPGIDLSGVVEESASPRFAKGDRVILTGWGIGETRWGGFAQRVRAPAEFLVLLPNGADLQQAMEFGTAGLTAMLCVEALERHGIARSAPVLVTGAGGGVGSIAISILKKLGYTVVASSGRADLHNYLTDLGAAEVLPRDTLAQPQKPLGPERWGAAVDTVGGTTLATVLAGIRYGGAVAACGLAGGSSLPATVIPFILRGVALLGVDSVRCPPERRTRAWARLAELFPEGLPRQIVALRTLDELIASASDILDGRIRGRIVVDIAHS